jgi:hypothetical protein
LGDDFLVGLVVGALVTYAWKNVKMPEILFGGAYEVVVEFAIYKVKEKLTIIRSPNFVEGLDKRVRFRGVWGSLIVTDGSQVQEINFSTF